MKQQQLEDKVLLTREEAAALCGISWRTFVNHVAAGRLPQPVLNHTGRGRRWSRKQLEEWTGEES